MQSKILFIALVFGLVGCGPKENEVIVYCSLDEIHSREILKGFEEKTGIKVKSSWDTEATKTTGLVNKLIAEKNNPICDVFWNNEVAQTMILKKEGLLAPYLSPAAKDIPSKFKDKDGYWTGFAARARVIIYNKELVGDAIPKSIYDFLDPKWKGKMAIASPLFGTTATHAAALFCFLGEEKAKEYFAGLRANEVIICDGNAHVKDQVAAGEVYFGLTDTDDANLAILAREPVGVVYPDQAVPNTDYRFVSPAIPVESAVDEGPDQKPMGTLVIPNSVALIKGSPHPQNARLLIDYLLSAEVEEKLAFSRSVQMPLRPGVKRPATVPAVDSLKVMEVDFVEVGARMRKTARYLQETFLR